MDREERIKEEEKRIKSILSKIPRNVKKTTEKLVKRAAFLLILTEDIEDSLQDDDFLKTTINASQEFTKANPLLKEYRDTVKSYQAVIKQLTDLALLEDKKDEGKSSKPDEFIGFCTK
ncbi:MAG: hypothetical protein IJ772_05935 [Bacilli bacterium]|nr:hypothetical protein [Bacilli bacterium]